jgi:hypothetical protein
MRESVVILLAALALSGCDWPASGCTELRDEHEADRRGLQQNDPDTMRRVADRIRERPDCFSTQERLLAE